MKAQINRILLSTLFTMVFFSWTFAQPASIATATKANTGFNRSVDNLKFSKDRSGRKVLRIQVGLEVFDKTRNSMNMNFDVQILKNGRMIKRIQQNARKNGAIYCAVTFSGECPSIFGDGVCTGCSCDYGNWLSAGIGDPLNGDVFEVRIVPARGGLKEMNTRDDRRRIVFQTRVRS